MTAIQNSNILELAGLFSQYLVTTHGDENLGILQIYQHSGNNLILISVAWYFLTSIFYGFSLLMNLALAS